MDQCPGGSTGNTLTNPHIDENNIIEEKTPKEKMTEMLDILETHVERLRKDAIQLEEEKDNLLSLLDTIRQSDNLNFIEESDKEDIIKCTERIINRCLSVEIQIHTKRNKIQEDALFQVNNLIDNLVTKLKNDPEEIKKQCLSYMNACSSHFVDGIMDKNFEAALVGCTLADQKQVKKRLQGLLDYFNKLDQ